METDEWDRWVEALEREYKRIKADEPNKLGI